MSIKIEHDDSPDWGATRHSATITIGSLSMAGRSTTRSRALQELRQVAGVYQRMIERAVEAIEAEIKEVDGCPSGRSPDDAEALRMGGDR